MTSFSKSCIFIFWVNKPTKNLTGWKRWVLVEKLTPFDEILRYMWIWIANKFVKFHAKRLNQSENIYKKLRGYVFETPCRRNAVQVCILDKTDGHSDVIFDDNNNNNSKTIFMVLSSWQSHSESSPGSFDQCRTAPSGRRPKTKPNDLGCESACTGFQSLQPPSPFIIITQPESWYWFYRPTEGRKLSRLSWLVTCQDGLPVHRRSPIPILTGSDVAQLQRVTTKPDRQPLMLLCDACVFRLRRQLKTEAGCSR